MDDEKRERVLREAREHIAAARELEREHAQWLARHDPLQEDAQGCAANIWKPNPCIEMRQVTTSPEDPHQRTARACGRSFRARVE